MLIDCDSFTLDPSESPLESCAPGEEERVSSRKRRDGRTALWITLARRSNRRRGHASANLGFGTHGSRTSWLALSAEQFVVGHGLTGSCLKARSAAAPGSCCRTSTAFRRPCSSGSVISNV